MVFKIEKLLFAVVFCVVFEYYTRKMKDEPTNFHMLMLLGFLVLGLAPAIRNLMRITMGL